MKKLALILIALMVSLSGCSTVREVFSFSQPPPKADVATSPPSVPPTQSSILTPGKQAQIYDYLKQYSEVQLYRLEDRGDNRIDVWLNFWDMNTYQTRIERIGTDSAYDIAGFFNYHVAISTICVHVVTPQDEPRLHLIPGSGGFLDCGSGYFSTSSGKTTFLK